MRNCSFCTDGSLTEALKEADEHMYREKVARKME
jgi:hypothetical protein